MRFSSRPAHRSEIMTSGWCVWRSGGAGSLASGLKYRGMGRFAGQAAAHAGGVRYGTLQGARLPRIRRPGEVAMRVDSRSQAARVPGDAARDAPGLRCHKPKTPIGRRGESLMFFCGLTASGQPPRRPRFTIHQPEAETPAGASARPGRGPAPRANIESAGGQMPPTRPPALLRCEIAAWPVRRTCRPCAPVRRECPARSGAPSRVPGCCRRRGWWRGDER